MKYLKCYLNESIHKSRVYLNNSKSCIFSSDNNRKDPTQEIENEDSCTYKIF